MIRSLDFIAAGFARANPHLNGVVASVISIACLLWPILLAVLPVQSMSKYQIFAFSLFTLLPALIYVRCRESQIRSLVENLPGPGSGRASNVLLLSFLTIMFGSIAGGRHSPIAALFAFAGLTFLPWASWAGIKNAS